MRLLVVEDKPALLKLVCSHLKKHGLVADPVVSLADAQASLASADYDVILLDLTLPDGDGADFLEELQRARRKTAVIIISGRDTLADRIKLLNAGADDYLVKPFDFDELVARIRAISRRTLTEETDEERIAFADLLYYPRRREVVAGGRHVMLRQREAALLETLLGRAGTPIHHELLTSCVSDCGVAGGANSVPVYIHHLRQRLAEVGAKVDITAIRGIGYALRGLGD